MPVRITRRAAVRLAGVGVLAAILPPAPVRAGGDGAHAFAFDGIEGGAVRLAEFAGGPVLVVNTASRCGFTGQYEGLQTLWEEYGPRGLTVLGVPSDDFNQELADEAAVKDFCETTFAIDFPMTTITPVKGRDAHPFYAWAAAEAGPPRWNFHKYLVGPDGRLAESFATGIEPGSAKVRAAIERLLPES